MKAKLENVLRQVQDLQPTTANEVAGRFADMSSIEAKKLLKELKKKNFVCTNYDGRYYLTHLGDGLVIRDFT